MADGPSKRARGEAGSAAADEAGDLAAALATAAAAGDVHRAGADGARRPAAGDDRVRRPRRGRYRFVNTPLAEWLEQPRNATARAAHARGDGRGRLSRAQADDRGRAGRASGSSSPPSSTIRRAGSVAVQTDYVPWADAATGRSTGVVMLINDVTEQRVDRARAARERGAVPADRQFGAGDDVGDPARPRARLRQRRLCRVRRRAGLRPRGGADARLAHANPSRRRRPDRRREHRRRSDAASRSRSRGATGATTANGAGCAACRSRASAPTASWSGSSASPSDITLAKEAELELRRQVEEQTAQLALSRSAVPRGVRQRRWR